MRAFLSRVPCIILHRRLDRLGWGLMQDAAAGADDAKAGRTSERRTAALEDSDKAFLARLGQRVRQSRAVRGMSRKVLARESNISERYIAQLESGEGNVSIILLRRVAAATGCRLEELIADR